MRYTINKNMNLPEYTDIIDIEKINENFETIDEHFTDPEAHAELFSALETKIDEHFTDPEAHAELFSALETKVLVLMDKAIKDATDALINMIMVSDSVTAQLATSDDTALCTNDGDEIIAVKKF